MRGCVAPALWIVFLTTALPAPADAQTVAEPAPAAAAPPAGKVPPAQAERPPRGVFRVNPPGKLQHPRGTGIAEYRGHAPGMRFPIGTYDATLNSQLFAYGGLYDLNDMVFGTQLSRGGECSEENFGQDWWDTFSFSQGTDRLLGDGKAGDHVLDPTNSGIEIRAGNPKTCERLVQGQRNIIPVLAVYPGQITAITQFAVTLKTTDKSEFVYWHMDLAPELTSLRKGDTVESGQIIGYLSNRFGDDLSVTAMSHHLKLEHWVERDIDGQRRRIPLPLYCDLVLAYERDRGKRHEMIGGGPRCGEAGFTVTLDGASLDDVKPGAKISLNGREMSVSAIDPQTGKLTLLGDEKALLDGLNSLKLAARQMVFWRELDKLQTFANPYKSSYAVIAAIDDYDRTKDPQKRGATGYQKLTHMVEQAEALKAELIRHGFPPENITTLYDEAATSSAFDAALGEFHPGGKHDCADRVLVYFGGHGDGKSDAGFLVTYDFDPKRPTRSGFPMARFTAEHFPGIKAKHLLVALDSCSSGMAVRGMFSLDGEPGEDDLKRLATLKTIHDETREPARNMIVAGTNDQKALWEKGGVFTQALVKGLAGEADYIRDGVIQFDELSLYVTRAVRSKAATATLQQDPRAFSATSFGTGKMLFIAPGRL